MSALIWALALLTLASSGLCEIPAPVNLSISSRNFIPLLTWEPGPGSPDNLSYTVEVYSLEDNISLNVPWCEDVVSPLVCNLTGLLANPSYSYYPHVWAKLGNESSKPAVGEAFIPMDHTYLDPPLLSVSVCKDSLCVGLRPPSSRLRHDYSTLRYTLTVTNSKDGAQFNLSTRGLLGVKIDELEPGRKYCVTATIANRKSASSQPRCAVTAVLSSADKAVSIGLCVLLIVVVTVLLLLVYTGFIFLRTTIPETLVSVKGEEVLLLPSTYDWITHSLLRTEGKAARQGGRNGTRDEEEEEEEEEESGSGGAGYERWPPGANEAPCSGGSASGSSPLGDGLLPPAKPAGRREGGSLSRTGGPYSPRCVNGAGPLRASQSGVSMPPSVPTTDSGQLPPSWTGEGPAPGDGHKDHGGPPGALETGPRAEREGAGPEGRPSAGWLWDGQAEEGEEPGSGLNVNLESVMMFGREEEAEEDEDEEDEEEDRPESGYECRPFILGVSSDPLPVLPVFAAVREPPLTQPCPVCSEEEDREDDDDDDEDDEECSGYMRRGN